MINEGMTPMTAELSYPVPLLQGCLQCGEESYATLHRRLICNKCVQEARWRLALANIEHPIPTWVRENFDDPMVNIETHLQVAGFVNLAVFLTGERPASDEFQVVSWSPDQDTLDTAINKTWIKCQLGDLVVDEGRYDWYWFSRKTGVDSSGQYVIFGTMCNTCGVNGAKALAASESMYCEDCLATGFLDEFSGLIREAEDMASNITDSNSLDELASAIDSLLDTATQLRKELDTFEDANGR